MATDNSKKPLIRRKRTFSTGERMLHALIQNGMMPMAISFALLVVGFFMLQNSRTAKSLDISPVLSGITVATGLSGVAAAMAAFLKNGKKIQSSQKRDYQPGDRFVVYHSNSVQEASPASKSAQGMSEDDQAELKTFLRSQIEKAASTEFLEELKKTLASTAEEDKWEGHFEASLRRIELEILSQGQRGELNLILGVLAAIIGVIVLGVLVYSKPSEPVSLNSFFLTFLPRVSLVTIIEVFAYFFLRLYKASLAEIKYFQNEATNLEARFLGLRIALKSASPELITETTKALLSTERNPTLIKEHTTLELEKERMDREVVALSVPNTLALFQNLAPKEKKNGKE